MVTKKGTLGGDILLFRMAKSEEEKIPMDPKYLDRIAERMKEAKVAPQDVGSKSGRVLEHRIRTRGPGQLSVTMINAIARELSRRGYPTPPPMVAVIDEEDYRWIELGRLVREANPSHFRLLLTALQGAVDELNARGLKKSQDAIDSALNLVDEPTKKSSKVKRRRGVNE